MGNCTTSQEGINSSFAQKHKQSSSEKVVRCKVNIGQSQKQLNFKETVIEQNKVCFSTSEANPSNSENFTQQIPDNRIGNKCIKPPLFKENLEQIEELESSNYLFTELKSLKKHDSLGSKQLMLTEEKNDHILFKKENEVDSKIILKEEDHQIPQSKSFHEILQQQPQQNQIIKDKFDWQQINLLNTSETSSPARSQIGSTISVSMSGIFSGFRLRSAQEMHTILRMKTQKFFSKLTSLELTMMLKRGANLRKVLNHFEFNGNAQQVDLIREIFTSVVGKNNKIESLCSQQHKDMLESLITNTQNYLSQGIEFLISMKNEYSKKKPNDSFRSDLSSCNLSFDIPFNNQKLPLITLSLTVEIFQVIQFFTLPDASEENSNWWWIKNDERNFSCFERKLQRLQNKFTQELFDKKYPIINHQKIIESSSFIAESQEGDHSSQQNNLNGSTFCVTYSDETKLSQREEEGQNIKIQNDVKEDNGYASNSKNNNLTSENIYFSEISNTHCCNSIHKLETLRPPSRRRSAIEKSFE